MNIGKFSVPSAVFFCKLKTAIQRKAGYCEFAGSPEVRTFMFSLLRDQVWSLPGEGNGNPLQHSCLEKFKDRGADYSPWGHKESDTTEWVTLGDLRSCKLLDLVKKNVKRSIITIKKKIFLNPLLIFKRCLSNALLAPTHWMSSRIQPVLTKSLPKRG